MYEYWIIPAGVVRMASNALEILHTDDVEARSCARGYYDAIMAGEYDQPWGLRDQEDRELSAQGLELWRVKKTRRGAIYRAIRLKF